MALPTDAQGRKYENDDPKGAVGATKVDLSIIPPVALVHMALALQDGARKYGPWNWRGANVSNMTYMSAIGRHEKNYIDGEDYAEDSHCHHLAHIMASCAITLDAGYSGTLVDNRPTPGGYKQAIKDAEEILKSWRERDSEKCAQYNPDDDGWIVADPSCPPKVLHDVLWHDGNVMHDCPPNDTEEEWRHYCTDDGPGDSYITHWRPSEVY